MKTGDPRWLVDYVDPLYIIGDMNGWDRTAMTVMTFNAETQAYEYEYAPTKMAYFAFSDKLMTAEEAAADEDWSVFNTTRYALGEGNVDATLNAAVALQKVNGTIVLPKVKEGTTYKISVAKDLSTITITGEVDPEPTYVVAGNNVTLFGEAWNGSKEENSMTLNTETGKYEKKYTSVSLTAGNIEYKIVMNGNVWIPDGNNLIVEIAADGAYDVIFTFDPATNEITGVATVTTGIAGIKADSDLENAVIYNVNGQRMDKAHKGLYIVNGRKVVIK